MPPYISLFEFTFLHRILASCRLTDSTGMLRMLHLGLAMLLLWTLVFLSALVQDVALPKTGLKIPMIYDIPLYCNVFFAIPFFIYGFFIFELNLNAFISWVSREKRILIDSAELNRLVNKFNILCSRKLFDCLFLALAILTIFGWIIPEFTNNQWTWPTLLTGGGVETPTIAGIIAITYYVFLEYLMYAFIFRVALWIWFLYTLSKRRLRIDPIHPDQCGGFNPINIVQRGFAFPISALGFLICGAILNNYLFLQVSIVRIDHLLMVISFVLMAPIFFFVPLYFFRRHLWIAKRQAISWADSIANDIIHAIMQQMSNSTHGDILEKAGFLETLDFIGSYRDRIIAMRVLPFDFRSLKSFLGMAYAPLISLVLPFLPKTAQNLLSIVTG